MTQVRKHADSLRGAAKLLVVATTGITDVVEEMHARLAPPLIDRFVPLAYAPIRGIAELVGASLDLALRQVGPLLGTGHPSAEQSAFLAALNGVVGDYLAESQNPLAITMSASSPQSSESGEIATGKILVLVHGSCMNDLQWNRHGHDHGLALARDLGFTPVYVRYNSGLHISTNGRELAALLEDLVSHWPVPVRDVSLLGHSMGGLVARSACHVAPKDATWRRALRRLVCLGSPHHGSPLERSGNVVDVLLGASSYSAPLARLARIRSAGVTDLRYGSIADEDWQSRDRFVWQRDSRKSVPLPPDVACYAIAGVTKGTLAELVFGDGLVPVESALGRHADPERALAFPPENQWVAPDTAHLDLLSSPAVYDQLRVFFTR